MDIGEWKRSVDRLLQAKGSPVRTIDLDDAYLQQAFVQDVSPVQFANRTDLYDHCKVQVQAKSRPAAPPPTAASPAPSLPAAVATPTSSPPQAPGQVIGLSQSHQSRSRVNIVSIVAIVLSLTAIFLVIKDRNKETPVPSIKGTKFTGDEPLMAGFEPLGEDCVAGMKVYYQGRVGYDHDPPKLVWTILDPKIRWYEDICIKIGGPNASPEDKVVTHDYVLRRETIESGNYWVKSR